MFLKQIIMPKDIDISNNLFNSSLNRQEKETIAKNIIILSCWNDNKWLDFSWEEYKKRCDHRVINIEKYILDDLVRDGLLKNEDGIYSVKDTFIQALRKFVKKRSSISVA